MSVNNKPTEGRIVFTKHRTQTADIETGITSTTKTAVWRINDFAKFRKVDLLIQGQKFELDVTDNNGVTSQFRVSLVRTMEENETYVEHEGYMLPEEDNIGLSVKLLSKDEVALKFSAEVEGATGRNLYSVKDEEITSADENDEITYPGLLNNRQPESILPLESGHLIIHLKFEVFSAIPDSGVSASIQMKNQHLLKFQKIMGFLENNIESSVVTIISNDGEKFPVQKFILTNISSVFETMLNSDMDEKKTGEIRLNLSAKCVKILRQFIYTGKLADGWKEPGVVVELANAAEMYCLDHLVLFLDKVLGGVCTAENAPELMVLANQLGMKMAEKQTLSMMKRTIENAEDFLAVAKRLRSE